MSLTNADQTEAELERLRIELAILRAAKVRADLTKLVNNSAPESLGLQEIGRLDASLHDLEIDARDLVHEIPAKPAQPASEPFLLRDPLPKKTTYTIERVAEKFSNLSQSPQT